MKTKLIPWRRGHKDVALRGREENPFAALHEGMDRLFEDFFGEFETALQTPGTGWMTTRSGGSLPRLDVAETDEEVRVTADLPGMTDKDVSVSLDGDLLTIRGHREESREDKKANYHMMERSYGEFHRVVNVPAGVDPDKVKATFRNGVLHLTLPKRPEVQGHRKQIPVRAG